MAKQRSPVLGYNTNLRYRGLVFHVQTEDSGVANPHIFTHLFYEGTILGSRKTVYEAASSIETVKGLMQAQQKAVLKELKKQAFDDKIDQLLVGTPGLLARGAVEAAPEPASAPKAEPPPPPPPAPVLVAAPRRAPTPHAGVVTGRSAVIMGSPSRNVTGRQAAVTIAATGPQAVLLDRFLPVLQPKLLGLADLVGTLGAPVRALAAGLDRRPADLSALPGIIVVLTKMQGDERFTAHVQVGRALGDGRTASETDVVAGLWSVTAALERLTPR